KRHWRSLVVKPVGRGRPSQTAAARHLMPRNLIDGGAYREGTSQSISCTTTSTALGSAFGANTWAIRVAVSGAGNTHYRTDVGTPTAVTSDPFLPNAWVEVVLVSPSMKLAAITESGASTVTVTELTQ